LQGKNAVELLPTELEGPVPCDKLLEAALDAKKISKNKLCEAKNDLLVTCDANSITIL
jgi:hypothetical protein